MSQENYLRQQVQDQMRNNPSMDKVEVHQAGDYWTQQVINSEIEHQRRLREEEARRQANR